MDGETGEDEGRGEKSVAGCDLKEGLSCAFSQWEVLQVEESERG